MCNISFAPLAVRLAVLNAVNLSAYRQVNYYYLIVKEQKMAINNSRIKMIICIGVLVSPVSMADESQLEAGGELYAEFCAGCHGANNTGLSDYRGDLAALTERLEGLTEEMPDFAGFFEEDEVAALHVYLTASDIVN